MSDRSTLPDGGKQAISLEEIAEFLDEFFAIEKYSSDQNGIYLPSNRSIKRIGIALKPWTELAEWVNTDRLDALFLHRPWTLELEELPSDLGILSYHKAFDEHLTLGFNSRLASAVGLRKLEVLGYKEGRAIGMLGEITEQPFLESNAPFKKMLSERIKSIFGGYEQISFPRQNIVSRVAIVGALTSSHR
jgi:putative NIF3 family GTP cyclohydrolase 1 type 2